MVRTVTLIWDIWNVDHISKHNVTVAEVESSLKDKRARFKEGYSNRVMALGKSGKRLLAVVLAEEGTNKYYVITARDMDKKERVIYRSG